MKLKAIGLLPNFSNDEYKLARQLYFHQSADYSRELAQFKIGIWQLFNRQHLEADLTDQELLSKTAADNPEIFLYDSARSAFSVLLDAVKSNIPAEEFSQNPKPEVIMPSFSCVVILNPVNWAGFQPIFTDINPADFNAGVEELMEKVTTQTKAILVQHTFGAVIDVRELRKELKKIEREDIIIVEDLAHVLGASSKPVESQLDVERFALQGDFGVLTFGVEKVISTIRGGALVVNTGLIAQKKNNETVTSILEEIRTGYPKLPDLPKKILRRILYNPLFWQYTTAVYYKGKGKFTLGRILTVLGHKLGLLGIAIDETEYSGGKPAYLPAKFAAILAPFGVMQLRKLDETVAHRRKLAETYAKGLVESKFTDQPEQQFLREILKKNDVHGFLRYPLMLKSKKQRQDLFESAKKHGYILGDWYKTMFYTKPEFYKQIGYKKGSCPIAEDISKRIVNLPTASIFSVLDAEKIVDLIKQLS